MARTSRYKYAYRKNASKLHKRVGEILRSGSFSQYSIYQEYPVKQINKLFPYGNYYFDWVIPKLKIVIECHGLQHFQPVSFSGNNEEAISAFHDTQFRDNKKKEAALDAGYRYVVVKYSEEKTVTERVIFDRIKEADTELDIWKLENRENPDEITTNFEAFKQKKQQDNKEKRKEYLQSDKHKKQLEKNRENRRKQYRKAKERKQNDGQ